MPVKQIRIALGAALIALAIIMGCRLLSVGPFGAVGTATGLTGIKLVIGIVVNFFLGAFMTIGVGLYAPCMAMIGALGMNIQAAFPVMMGSCAFLMPACGIKFIKEGKYDRKASVLLTVGGVIGVLIAYFLVKSMPMTCLLYTSLRLKSSFLAATNSSFNSAADFVLKSSTNSLIFTVITAF